jgi:hypothetical protein
MRKFVVTLMASLLSCSTASAFWPEALDSSLEIGVGYRRDTLEFKTHVNCDNEYCDDSRIPFELGSHVKWKDLNIWQIEAKGKYVTCDNIYLRANGDYGWITSGKRTESVGDSFSVSDYYFAQSFSDSSSSGRSNSKKPKGHVYDLKFALGYQFKMCDDSFAIAPLIGYSWNGQHIKGRNKDNHDYSDYDCFAYSDSSSGQKKNGGKYDTRWNGPFVGFDFDYRFGCGCEADWEVFGSYEFHWADFHASADWNRHRRFCHGFHQHSRRAYGNVFDIGIKWDFCECWTLALKGEFQWWCADKGHDRTKFLDRSVCDVGQTCYFKTRLKHVKWQSAGVSFDVGMVF